MRRLAGQPGKGRPGVILLSRPDTAELVKAFFADKEVPLGSATIDFFGYSDACRFIDLYMQRKHDEGGSNNYDVARRHHEAFGELRDRQFSSIATVLLDEDVSSAAAVWDRVSSFLGYAPVLAVVAEFLAVPNPHQEIALFGTRGSSPRKVLLTIVQNLLEREQGKFQDQVLPVLQATMDVGDEWTDPRSVYSPGEQSVRLVGRVHDSPLVTDLPAILPRSIRRAYEDAATQFIADHPFLAGRDAVNAVFADYIAAKAVVDPTVQAALDIGGKGASTAPGPFFYQFVHEFSEVFSPAF